VAARDGWGAAEPAGDPRILRAMRRFRFGLGTGRVETAGEFSDAVRRADASGYDVVLIPDHLGVLSPEVAMMAAAERSDRLRIGSFVFNNDFRHPVVLARQAASLDLLSGGRLELGLGAGWNVPEYEAAGIAFDRGGIRVSRMEESVRILKALFAGDTVDFVGEHYTITNHTLVPAPPQGADLPIFIGGNGDRMLAIGARHADIVGLTGFRMVKDVPVTEWFGAAAIARRLAHVRGAAGDRAHALELNALIQNVIITKDRRAAARKVVDEWGMAGFDIDVALDTPFMLFGSVRDIADQLRRYREELGFTYFAVGSVAGPGFDAVVEELAGS